MANSLVKLIKSVIESYMEGFETAFPAVVKKVNGDGTVDVTPSVRNTLKNMQIEPDGEDGIPLQIEGVPVMWPGTSSAIVKFELSAGDPLLCIASSRDLREWVDHGEGKGPYSPKSFSGNDLNDLVAVPLSRGGQKKVTVNISHDGNVTIEADSVTIDADEVNVDGDLSVDGKISAKGDVESEGTLSGSQEVMLKGVPLSTHIHSGGTIDGFTGNPVLP